MSGVRPVIAGGLPVDAVANSYFSQLGVTQRDYIIIDPLSIGDAYQTLCLLKGFRDKYIEPGSRLIYWCRPRSASIAPLFGVADLVVNSEIDYNICYMFAQRYALGPGAPIVVGPGMHADGWLQRLMDHQLITPLHARRLILGLDLDSEVIHLVTPDTVRAAARATAEAAGVVPGQSLLILNHATTTLPLAPSVFEAAVAAFKGPVFTDVTRPDAPLISGTRPISIPLDQLVAMAEIFGTVLTLRSGLVDLLSNARTKIYSIYPRPCDAQTWVTDRAAWVSAYRGLTLDRIGFGGVAEERPIYLAAEDHDADISDRLVDALAEP